MLGLAVTVAAGCSGPGGDGGDGPDATDDDSSGTSASAPALAIGEPCDQGDVCAAEPNADSACITGECTLVCHDGFANCDHAVANGCEQSLITSTSCGGCFVACDPKHAFGSCLTGVCEIAACDLGWGDCDGVLDNGCETSLATPEHCGGCGVLCEAEHGVGSCNGGTCTLGTCDEGWGDCDGEPANGCEFPLGTDSDCAACGDDCSVDRAIASCVQGACEVTGCDVGWGACDADPLNGCETEVTSLEHCGGCERPCVADNATVAECEDGACVFECVEAYGDCDGVGSNGCEELLMSDDHCGACGDGCVFEHTVSACEDGQCVISACEEGWGDCDDAPGCETALDQPDSCGGCHISCTPEHECLESGACAPVLVWSLPPVAAEIHAVAIDPTGNVFVAGDIDGAAMVASRAPDGGPRWMATSAAAAGGSATFHGLAVSAAGEACAVGAANGDVRVLALTATGEERWVRSFGGDSDVDVGLDVGVTTEGDAVVVGRFIGPMVILGQPVAGSVQWEDPFIVAFEPDGALRWSRGLASVTEDDAQHVAVDAAGNSYVSGAFDDLLMFDGEPLLALAPNAAWVASFKPDGDARWSRAALGMVPADGTVSGLGVGGDRVSVALSGDLQSWSQTGADVATAEDAGAVADLAVAPDGRIYGVATSGTGAVVTAWTPEYTLRWTLEIEGPFGQRPRLAVGSDERLAVAGGQAIATLDDGGWAPPPEIEPLTP